MTDVNFKASASGAGMEVAEVGRIEFYTTVARHSVGRRETKSVPHGKTQVAEGHVELREVISWKGDEPGGGGGCTRGQEKGTGLVGGRGEAYGICLGFDQVSDDSLDAGWRRLQREDI